MVEINFYKIYINHHNISQLLSAAHKHKKRQLLFKNNIYLALNNITDRHTRWKRDHESKASQCRDLLRSKSYKKKFFIVCFECQKILNLK